VAENTVAAKPPVAQNDARGGSSSIDTNKFIGPFGGTLRNALPANANPNIFIGMLRSSLSATVMRSGKMITVGEFSRLVRDCANVAFDPAIAKKLDDAMRSLVPPTDGVVSGEIGRPRGYQEGDLLRLDLINQALDGLRH